MTDARVLNTVRSWVNRLTLTQELIVLAGVIVFLGGLFIVAPLWKFLAFAAGVLALAYVVVTVRLKGLPDLESEDSFGNGRESIPSEELESDMHNEDRDETGSEESLRGR